MRPFTRGRDVDVTHVDPWNMICAIKTRNRDGLVKRREASIGNMLQNKRFLAGKSPKFQLSLSRFVASVATTASVSCPKRGGGWR